MKTSESIKNLTQALLRAQTSMGAATKGAKNPFFKSSYADLPTVMEVVKEPLNSNGIIVLQPANHTDGRNFITTTLIHAETGEWMESTTEVICSKANDPQAFGAAQTYSRRFGLQSMLFIPAEDDDGNTASGRTTSTKAYTAPIATTVATAITTPTTSKEAPAEVKSIIDTGTLKSGIKTSSFSKKNKATPAVPTTIANTNMAFE